MRRFTSLAILAAFMALLLLAGCSRSQNSLAGTWKAEEGTMLTLRDDGTGTILYRKGKLEPINWTVKNREFTSTSQKSGGRRLFGTLSPDKKTLTCPTGNEPPWVFRKQ